MCGIVGLVDLQKRLSPDELRRVVESMRDAMTHRGPDDAGTYLDPDAGCALAHRRLSIIDLSPLGRQPMTGDGTDVYVTYNGEIYNFREIRETLAGKNATFHGQSDTEVLPFLFRDLDPMNLRKLNGMFAFGCWHQGRRQLLLARDPFGKKPLYIYEDERFFAFASELQVFQHIPGIDLEIDRDALAEYLLVSYVSAPRTIYSKVRQIEPGAFALISFADGHPVVVDEGRYFAFHPAGSVEAQEIDPRIRKEELRERLIGAVERRLISDVPLGAFLSGGVDSALVVAVIMKDLGRELDTFSIGFADTAESEHEAAREIANHLGTRHHEEILQPDAVDLVQHIAARLDHPNGDSSCLPTYLLSAFARRHVTVAISGDGGDEMFGGYGRYRDTLNEWGDPDQIRRVHGIANPAKASPSDLYMSLRWHIWLPNTVADLLGGMPDGAAERLALWRAWLDRSEQPLMHRMRRVDASFYLPGAVLAKVDRMSMLHSLEVRSPLLDKDVAEFASLLSQQECWTPPDGTKHILKELASDYLPREWMNRPKKGFGLPSNAWSIEQMIGLARDLLLTSDTHLTDLMDRKQLTRLVEAQSTPQTFSIYQIWPLLVLEIWLRHQPGRQMWNKHAPTTGLSSLASRAARWMN